MKPFDLEAAKRGEPIVCRDGTPAKFIAHVPEAAGADRVVVLVNESVLTRWENGALGENEYKRDLFMAPKKVTRWVNVYDGEYAGHYGSEATADEFALADRRGGRAYPIEIED